jgi:hypothetical protein
MRKVEKSVAKGEDERGEWTQRRGLARDRQEEYLGRGKVQGEPGGIERKDRCGM